VPFAASFITYLAGMTISIVAIKKLRASGRNYIGAAFAIFGLFIEIFLIVGGDSASSRAGTTGIMADENPRIHLLALPGE